MIDPITGLTLAAQAGTGIYQMYKGAKQAQQAEDMYKDYTIPQEIYDTLSSAEIQALEGLPAAQKAQYIQNINRSTQSGLNALKDRKSSLSGVEGIYRNEQDAYGNLLAQDAMARQQNQANLQGVRNNMAGYQDKSYDMNVLQPYMAMMQSAEGMKGAGMQNIIGTLKSGSQMSQDNRFLQDILGQQKTNQDNNLNVGYTRNIPDYGNTPNVDYTPKPFSDVLGEFLKKKDFSTNNTVYGAPLK